MRPLALPLLLTLLLAACATSYQPRGKGTMGYFEQQQAADQWEIGFNAQRQTDWPTIDEYLHRRADELARAQGWKGYVIIGQTHDTHEDRSDQTQSFSLPFETQGSTGSAPGNPTPQLVNYQLPFSYRYGHMLIAPLR